MTYDIAIIPVSTNKLHEECLASVQQLIDATPLRVVFVLVDNASTQFEAFSLTHRFVKDPIVLLRKKNHGFGRSCNRGAQEVDARYYFFLNPDTRTEDMQILTKLHHFLEEYPQVGIAAPRLRYMDGRIQETCRRFPSWFTPFVQRTSWISQKKAERHQQHFLMRAFDHGRRRMVDWVQGSAFLIEGKLFHELGGFDERFFMYYEDVDLCRRAWEQGRPVYYVPDVELFHAYGKESATDGTILSGLLSNRKMRVHALSWLQYTWKWRTKVL